MAISVEYLPATGEARQQIVLLHGWASSRQCWRALVAKLRPWADLWLIELPGINGQTGADSLQQLADQVLPVLPERAVYLGWSLGGQLAVELAGLQPQRVRAVLTLCYNPNFIAADDWPGMAADDFERFAGSVNKTVATGLRRFDSLQASGAAQPRAVARALSDCRLHSSSPHYAQSLQWLRCDQRHDVVQLTQPQCHLLAAQDQLVPADLAAALSELLADNTKAQVQTLTGLCHGALLQAPEVVAHYLRAFLEQCELLSAPCSEQAPLQKADVARSFSRAACSYDAVAQLQRRVGERLLEEAIKTDISAPRRVVDLGCGTGYFQTALQSHFPTAQYCGIDLAEGMVSFARDKQRSKGSWLVADAELLPLAAESVDVVFSSLAIQWCYRPDLLFAEIQRLLRPGGTFVFSTLGPATLKELRSAWAAVDAYQHVNDFLPLSALHEAATAQPQLQMQVEVEQLAVAYDRVQDLLRDLKGLGAHNVNTDRPTGLSGRKALAGMMRAYQAFRDENGSLPASYEVYYAVVEKL